jgi:hypothetical protein
MKELKSMWTKFLIQFFLVKFWTYIGEDHNKFSPQKEVHGQKIWTCDFVYGKAFLHVRKKMPLFYLPISLCKLST